MDLTTMYVLVVCAVIAALIEWSGVGWAFATILSRLRQFIRTTLFNRAV